MGYSKSDVILYVEEEDVKFIRLAFVDRDGVQKNISIMPNELKGAFEKGVTISSKNICGFEEHGEIVLHPDANTISLLPWRPSQGRVIRMFCDLTTVDGREISSSSRLILKNVITENKDIASNLLFKSSFEFILLKLDEEGNPTNIPYDNAGYMDIAPLDKGENVRREICLSLGEMEITTSGSHHSYYPGQNSIIVSSSPILKAAENAMTFESVAKTISVKNGLFAEFSSSFGKATSTNTIIVSAADGSSIASLYANIKASGNALSNHFVDGNASISFKENTNEIVIEGIKSDTNFYIAYASILGALAK